MTALKECVQHVREQTRAVEGFLTDREGTALLHLAAACRPQGVIVEIGSWKGKSTVWLARGSQYGHCLPVIAIDPHTGSPEHQQPDARVWTFDEFQRNIQAAGVAEVVRPLVKSSVEACRDFHEPVELLFIDGAHEYESVKLDYETWIPLVNDGGVVAFHDYPWEGVRRMARHVFQSGPFRDVMFTDTLIYGRKTSRVYFWQRWRGRGMVFLSDQFDRANISTAPKWIRTIWKDLIKGCRFVLACLP